MEHKNWVKLKEIKIEKNLNYGIPGKIIRKQSESKSQKRSSFSLPAELQRISVDRTFKCQLETKLFLPIISSQSRSI